MKNIPITTTHTYYRVAQANSHSYFSPEGYSKFYDLKKQFPEKSWNQLYGYEQALDHISEIREKIYEGKKINKDIHLTIEIITETKTIIDV